MSCRVGFDVVRMHEVHEAGADQLALGPAERGRPRRVDRHDAGVERGDQHQLGRNPPNPVTFGDRFFDPAFEGGVQLFQLRPAFGQRRRCRALVSDVRVHAHPLAHLAAGSEHRDGADGEGAIYAVAAPNAVLEGECLAVPHRLVPGVDRGLRVAWVDGFGPAVASVLGLRLAGERGPARLFAAHSPGGVVGPDHAGDGPHGGPKPLLARLQRRLALADLVRCRGEGGGDVVDFAQPGLQGHDRLAASEPGGGRRELAHGGADAVGDPGRQRRREHEGEDRRADQDDGQPFAGRVDDRRWDRDRRPPARQWRTRVGPGDGNSLEGRALPDAALPGACPHEIH